MVADYYEKRRLIDESGWAASEAVTGDEEADRKLWQRFQTEAQQIAQSSKWKDANRMLGVYYNEVVPNWKHAFKVDSLKIQAANSKDRLLGVEWKKALENKDFKTADKILDECLRLGSITKVEYNEYKEFAPAEAQLLRADLSLDEGNTKEAIAELAELEGMELSPEQRDRRNSLRAEMEKSSKEASDEAERNYRVRIEKGEMGHEFRLEILNDQLIDPVRGGTLVSLIRQREEALAEDKEDPLTKTDPATYLYWSAKIARGEKVTVSDLEKATGHGLSTSDFDRLSARLPEAKEKSPLASPAVKRAIASLDDLRAIEVKGKPMEDVKNIEANYHEVINDFENWVEENKPDDVQIEDQFRKITEPLKKEAAEGLLRKALRFGSPMLQAHYWLKKGLQKRKGRPEKLPEEEPETEKTLTVEQAKLYLQLAGGDRQKAEEMARNEGYVW
jgi:hypothetical protein